jgi:hypothetical protein
MKKNILSVGVILFLAFFAFLLSSTQTVKQTNIFVTPTDSLSLVNTPAFIPHQAAFAIYTNGTLRQFSSAMYLNQSPDIFIEEINPNIIQVKKEGLTWQDFFNTLPFSVSPTCLTTGTGQTFCSNETTALRFFLNGTENPQLLQQLIQPNDRVLISYGVTTEAQVKQQYNSVPLFQ